MKKWIYITIVILFIAFGNYLIFSHITAFSSKIEGYWIKNPTISYYYSTVTKTKIGIGFGLLSIGLTLLFLKKELIK